ncbi:hypothetical protein J1N35_042852 [Gossypium stocksii]|uniref:CCHC-type domain-containing protein n=1 Tax=Gossypium stocksii TaxID=47602 RepID=A0A9D3U697_9ROSI|nr:hypothetical protein J1N35_042852 [Gossypium stocksii]
MMESGGDKGLGGEEISLLAKELIQLSVKSSLVEPTGPCPPEFDKKDLLHVIGVTFGGIIRSEIIGEFCRLRVKLDVQKPLRRGIFVSINPQSRSWVAFKYEKLSTFCFGCGRMGHDMQECKVLSPAEKDKIRKDPPFSIALKAKSNMFGKESVKFNALSKNLNSKWLYVGSTEKNKEL